MKVKPYIILNTSRKHVNYEEDKNKVPMNKPYNIQNTNICNGIFGTKGKFNLPADNTSLKAVGVSSP
jgi:hypothetical protein